MLGKQAKGVRVFPFLPPVPYPLTHFPTYGGTVCKGGKEGVALLTLTPLLTHALPLRGTCKYRGLGKHKGGMEVRGTCKYGKEIVLVRERKLVQIVKEKRK
jgi:hypothetical protein